MADKLKQAIQFIKAGDKGRARQLLIEKLKTDPKNDTAWVWMATVVETAELKRECLEEALKHNPDNVIARQALEGIEQQPSPSHIAAVAFDTVEARPVKTSAGRRKVNRFALPLFLVALIVIAATYFISREELDYRSNGEIISATILKMDKTDNSRDKAEVCTADYQFMAYGALRKGSSDFPCTEWNRLEKGHLIQVQFQASHPGLNRYFPRPQNEQLLMWGGFGLGGLLVIVSVILLAYSLIPKAQKPIQPPKQ